MEVAIYDKYHFFHYLVSEECVGILYNNLIFDLTLRNRNSYNKGQTSNYVFSAILLFVLRPMISV
jgi:hypothetical protein